MQEGEQFGPYSKAQLEVYLWEGNAQRSDLAWVEGTEEWLPLWQVMGLPPQPGELAEEEEAVPEIEEEAAPEAEPEPLEAAPLPVVAEAEPEPLVEEAPLPVVEAEPELVVEEAPVLEEPVEEETPPPLPESIPEPEAETEAPVEEEAVDDGRPKLIVPGKSAPKRKLKLNLPNS